MRTTPLALAFMLATLLAPASHLRAQTLSQSEFPSGWTPKTTQFANRDMVAAANPLEVEAGVTILGRGGAALDAAIAVQMMLTLVEPQSSGIGGGAFLMHYDGKAKKLVGYDGRETAPAAATPDQFRKLGKPLDFLRSGSTRRSLRWPNGCAARRRWRRTTSSSIARRKTKARC